MILEFVCLQRHLLLLAWLFYDALSNTLNINAYCDFYLKMAYEKPTGFSFFLNKLC